MKKDRIYICRYLKATIGYLAAMIPIEGVESLPKFSFMFLFSQCR